MGRDYDDDDAPPWLMQELLIGTACSGAGALIIILSYSLNKGLHKYRMLWHLVFKAIHILLMVAGYYFNLIPDFNCDHAVWCAFQFSLFQIGNCGILVSEAAMSLEMSEFTRQLRTRQSITNFKRMPESVRHVYLFYILFTVVSVGFGVIDIQRNTTCWLHTWCWYRQGWEFFIFKFAWIGAVIAYAVMVILSMEYHLYTSRDRGTPRCQKQMIRVLRNCLFCHIFSWGSTLLWRLGFATHSSYTKEQVLQFIVVTNGAGAGYLDVIVWLTFPAVRRRTFDPLIKLFMSYFGVESRPMDSRGSAESLNYRPPEFKALPAHDSLLSLDEQAAEDDEESLSDEET